MKVKVIKSSKNTYWYSDKIGRVFEVYEKIWKKMDGLKYRLKEEPICLLDVDDVEIIGDKSKEKVIFT